MTRSYMVVYERIAEENWGAWAQDIGGAVGAGESLEAARQSLRAGIAIMLGDLAERGVAAPPAATQAIDFSEFDRDSIHSHYEVEWMTVELPEITSGADTQQATAA